MFKLNKPISTINGETLIPFLVEGKTVYCFKGNKTIIKKLSDFDFSNEVNEADNDGNSTVIVSAIIPPTDKLFEPEKIDNGSQALPENVNKPELIVDNKTTIDYSDNDSYI